MQPSSKPFISFSINREDVLLDRLFGTVPRGFFIDVGAAHPVFENDTKALSDRGWTGINIEPNLNFFRELEAERPRDRNLCVAVGDVPGVLAFHEVVGTGLSTLDDEAAREAASQGFTVIDHQVEVRSLRDILVDAAPSRIDLLKIDVEGFELKVLMSNDWDRFRPSLIMTEATYPQTPVRRPDHITPYLAGCGYRHVYFDGLNDYYAEAGFDIPPGVFDVPLCVFDEIVPHAEVLLTQARDSLARDVEALRRQGASTDAYVASLTQTLAERETGIESLTQALRASHTRAEGYSDRLLAMTLDLQRANTEISNLRSEITDLIGAGADRAGVSMAYRVGGLQEEIRQLRASSSWRVTRPLRAIVHPKRTLMFVLKRLAR